jgi:hypothetical protein
MKSKKSKLSAIVFYTVITVLCLVFTNIVFAQQQYGDFTYTVSYGTVTITGYSCPLKPTEVVIPTTIDGMPVVIIRSSAFNNCRGLTSVTIPASVTSIGHGAFKGCKRLTKAYFLGNAPWMVKGYREFHFGYYVRDGVFDKCALRTVPQAAFKG